MTNQPVDVDPGATQPAGRRRPRGSYSKGRAKRAEILHEAVRVFAESGYRGGSLKEIADRVGLSQAGLLHHFASKEHLLAEVIAVRDAEDAARLFPADQPVTGHAALERLAEQVRHNTSVPGLVQLYTTLAGEAVAEGHPAREPFTERYRALRAMLRDAVSEAQSTGDIPAEIDADAAATALIALMDGLQIQWLLDPDAVDMPAVFELFLSSLRLLAR
ncbi:TetR/AcrR family transcriptional regulator [Cryptosporangium aurantiacum]|uniref:Transcriptional regulator, TetR family n=1 Tax=Cryptosporangium aurantiacum TaxID=134849 RepID=A0A1M7RJC4_9ACTN|nr:TetR/AcrR family transcriptional regulator [Cryptosporangium aurantiacum]SHN46241.1 transcriptional regulator, TetR family [Cryptosporangium aurantiacum]